MQVKLYDLRLVQRGSIQSYEGHVNSHTRIQIGVDPFEKFLMSGTFAVPVKSLSCILLINF